MAERALPKHWQTGSGGATTTLVVVRAEAPGFFTGTAKRSKWGFPSMGVPPVLIHFDGIFPYKPTSYWGTPFMETHK